MVEFTRHPLCAEDIDELLTIERLCFPTPWSRADFEHEAENPVAYYEVLKVGNCIAAYGGMWLLPFVGHITNIAVHPDERGKGYGETVTRALLQLCADSGMSFATLECRRSNTVAQSLYHKVGFVDVGYRKRYYENTEDALIMVCEHLPEAHPDDDPMLVTE